MANRKLAYGVDDRPPFPIMILAGFQHVLTLFGATTLVPLIFGPAMGMNTTQIGFFISCVYFAMGVATLIQTHPKLGSGLPIVQGSSFSFIPPIMTIIAAFKDAGPAAVMGHIGGALVVGGAALAAIGYTRLVSAIRKFVTPIVIGPTIMAIGFSLAPTAIQFNAAKYWPVSLLVVVCIFAFSLISRRKYLNIFAILSSIVIAYLVCLFGTMAGVFPDGHAAHVSLAGIASAPWFRVTGFLPWGGLSFDALSIGAVTAGFFAVMIESIGDYHSCSYVSNLPDPDAATISRGIGAEGANCVLAGLFGAIGTTSYTENIGLIGLTGVASRWVVRTGAILLIVMSFIGKLSALIATIPSPVIGGAYIALFGIIGALGIQVLLRADMNSQRNVLIVGFAFLMAMGLPGWVEANKDAFLILGIPGEVLWAILKTPMAVAGLCAAFWDSIVPGTPEERGIKA